MAHQAILRALYGYFTDTPLHVSIDNFGQLAVGSGYKQNDYHNLTVALLRMIFQMLKSQKSSLHKVFGQTDAKIPLYVEVMYLFIPLNVSGLS